MFAAFTAVLGSHCTAYSAELRQQLDAGYEMIM